MRRTQLYLDEEVWHVLHERARESGLTISELVRRAIQDRYLAPAEERRKVMQAFIGIREDNPGPTDTDAYIRRLRKGTRLNRLAS
ncbi:MAG: ribbon-helix-helix protein, CopG family [Bryobacterales bacterium]|nr:ribbon-helix-helix protein, CopG family [Bryobacterales bacterium]